MIEPFRDIVIVVGDAKDHYEIPFLGDYFPVCVQTQVLNLHSFAFHDKSVDVLEFPAFIQFEISFGKIIHRLALEINPDRHLDIDHQNAFFQHLFFLLAEEEKP